MGLYNIHLYYEDNSGHLIGVTSSTATLSASGKLSIQNVNHGAGTDVIIRQVASPVTIKAVKGSSLDYRGWSGRHSMVYSHSSG